jgi:hypothetical protein
LTRRRSPVQITRTSQSFNSVTTHDLRLMFDLHVFDHCRVCGWVELLPMDENHLLDGSISHYRRVLWMPRGWVLMFLLRHSSKGEAFPGGA